MAKRERDVCKLVRKRKLLMMNWMDDGWVGGRTETICPRCEE